MPRHCRCNGAGCAAEYRKKDKSRKVQQIQARERERKRSHKNEYILMEQVAVPSMNQPRYTQSKQAMQRMTIQAYFLA